ncbi:hypothetical protein CSE16_13670 [Solibacillus sp. R5-41]|uniref:VC0807 family protein n=1 Tax=Solibacillus sp. R5-41 TaxID=2048654 RepID=UPI000C12894D|nr:VC0807 family protein [Solibacillus sp. R5-41]ATP41014.1 hypothetical protein CSE16_13670 [Solibacillus sp. R5-41]
MVKRQRSNKRLILLDLIFYAALPYIIWNYGKEPFGDYAAMLISTIPGFVYTCYRFILDKQFNITGLFIIGSLALGTAINLISGSAEQMIWNGVYLGLFYTVIYFIALIFKRPFSLYFAVDFAYLQGYARKDSTTLFFQKGIFIWFQFIQVVFIVRGLFMAGLTVFLLKKYGIDGYGGMLIYKQIAGWIFAILIMGLFFYINIPVRRFFAVQQDKLQDKNKKDIHQSDAIVE